MSKTKGMILSALVAAMLAATALGEVTTFQQGVSPTKDYAGCVDTFIASHGWAHDRPSSRPRSTSLSRPTLMRFDLGAVGKDRQVRRAVLRLSFASIPTPGLVVEARTLVREWDATATWYEYTYKDAKKSPDNNWTKPGGDLDTTDFGAGAPGLVGKGTARGGPFGHVVEIDVTKLVGEWVSGKRPNHGFHLSTARGGFSVASAEWPMPACRPVLLIEHYKDGERPIPGAELLLPDAPGPKADLSPLAKPADDKQPAGPFKVVRFGRNANCEYRGGHAAGYAKQDPRYPGHWGWTPRLRIGGTAGDLNHAAFYFDLSVLPKTAHVRRATLKVFADMGNTPMPADTMGQVPEKVEDRQKKRTIQYFLGAVGRQRPYSFGLFAIAAGGQGAPGWKADEFTFARRDAGADWTGKDSNLADASAGAPVAVAHLDGQWKPIAAVRDKVSETWIEWDLTGLVGRWVRGTTPNRGVVLDGRLMGGSLTLLSDDWYNPNLRPYLEVEVSPAPKAAPAGELKTEPLLPPADHWVEAMKNAHARWKGTKGTFGQYGDSITITMAFWTPMSFGTYKGISPEAQEALDAVRKWCHKPCWRQWKGGGWGNTGNMTIAWAFANVDAWQKKMNPEVAVILFGTNDVGSGPRPPIYTEMYAAVIDRILADGTIPIITTLPAHGRQVNNVGGLHLVLDLRRAAIAVAKQKKVPLIDFYTEIVKRQPKQWRKILVPDGLHPSYPAKFRRDWSEEGLKNSGYDLRNYLTLLAWHDIHKKILKD